MIKSTKLAFAATLLFVASTASAQVITGTVRDFKPGPLSPGTTNPDFECCGIAASGLVGSTLVGSAPTLTNPGSGDGGIASAASFAEWYGAAAPSTSFSFTLLPLGGGIFGYTNSSFFPIDGMLLGDYPGFGHNFHFTFQFSSTFGYVAGTHQKFTFSGDDDVWVYFDKKLGIDLGGVHGTESQTVDMDDILTGEATGNYSLDFFFAERHTTESNFSIQTSLDIASTATPEPGSLLLLGTGLFGMGAVARRRRSR